jgi:hypothetical protein
MPIENMPEHHVIVRENDFDSNYTWYVFEGGVQVKKGDSYSTYGEARTKGYYWLRTEIGEGRL